MAPDPIEQRLPLVDEVLGAHDEQLRLGEGAQKVGHEGRVHAADQLVRMEEHAILRRAKLLEMNRAPLRAVRPDARLPACALLHHIRVQPGGTLAVPFRVVGVGVEGMAQPVDRRAHACEQFESSAVKGAKKVRRRHVECGRACGRG